MHDLGVVESKRGEPERGNDRIASAVGASDLAPVEGSPVRLDDDIPLDEQIEVTDPTDPELRLDTQARVPKRLTDEGFEPGTCTPVNPTQDRELLARRLGAELVEVENPVTHRALDRRCCVVGTETSHRLASGIDRGHATVECAGSQLTPVERAAGRRREASRHLPVVTQTRRVRGEMHMRTRGDVGRPGA